MIKFMPRRSLSAEDCDEQTRNPLQSLPVRQAGSIKRLQRGGSMNGSFSKFKLAIFACLFAVSVLGVSGFAEENAKAAPCKGPADVILTIDRSATMADSSKFSAAKSASVSFIDKLFATEPDPSYGACAYHQIGLVAFNINVNSESLNQNGSLIQDIINQEDGILGSNYPSDYRRTSTAIGIARNKLDPDLSSVNPCATKTMVVLTDGAPHYDLNLAKANADSAKSKNIRIVSVGLKLDEIVDPDKRTEAEDFIRYISSTPSDCYYISDLGNTLDNCISISAVDLETALDGVYNNITAAVCDENPPTVEIYRTPQNTLYNIDKLVIKSVATDDIGFESHTVRWSDDWPNNVREVACGDLSGTVIECVTEELGPFSIGDEINYRSTAKDANGNEASIDAPDPRSVTVADVYSNIPVLFRNVNNEVGVVIVDPKANLDSFFVTIDAPALAGVEIEKAPMSCSWSGSAWACVYNFNPGCEWTDGITDGSANSIDVNIYFYADSDDMDIRQISSAENQLLVSGCEGMGCGETGTCSDGINNDCDYKDNDPLQPIIDSEEMLCDAEVPIIGISRVPSGDVYDDDSVTFTSVATDGNGIKQHIIYYMVDGGSFQIAFECNDADADSLCDEDASQNIANISATLAPFVPGKIVRYYSTAVDYSGNDNLGNSTTESFVVKNRECEGVGDLGACLVTPGGKCCGGVCNAAISNPNSYDPDCAEEICGDGLVYVEEVWSAGKYGTALNFDGVDDFVEIPYDSSLNLGASSEPMTIELWVKLDDVPLSGQYDFIYRVDYYRFGINNQKIGAVLWNGNSVQSDAVVLPNLWYHTVFVWDGSNTKIYIDGAMDKSQDGGGSSASGSPVTHIGYSDQFDTYVDGIVDDVRIYNRALSAEEITEHYNGTFNNNTGLVGYWDFDEGIGTTAYDSSGSGNDGTITNFSTPIVKAGVSWQWGIDVAKNNIICSSGGNSDGCYEYKPYGYFHDGGCEERGYTCSSGFCGYGVVNRNGDHCIGGGSLILNDYECVGNSCVLDPDPAVDNDICDIELDFLSANAYNSDSVLISGNLGVPDGEVLDNKTNKVSLTSGVSDINGIESHKIYWSGGPERTAGKYGNGLSFDGVDDYVDCGDEESLNIADAITVEAWVKWAGNGSGAWNYNEIISKNSTGANNHGYELAVYDNRKVLFTINSINDSDNFIISDALVKDNLWSHIIGKFDGDKLYIYVDSVEKVEDTIATSINIIGHSFKIGGSPIGNFNGNIDDVRVYNRAISETEAGEHYNGTFNDNTGLVGYWDFDEASGNTAYDSSGNDNDGIIYKEDHWDSVECGVCADGATCNCAQDIGSYDPGTVVIFYTQAKDNSVNHAEGSAGFYSFTVRNHECYDVPGGAKANLTLCDSGNGRCCGGVCDSVQDSNSYHADCSADACDGTDWGHLPSNQDGNCGSADSCFDYYSPNNNFYSGCLDGGNKCSSGQCAVVSSSTHTPACSGNLLTNYGCNPDYATGTCQAKDVDIDCSAVGDYDNDSASGGTVCNCDCDNYDIEEKVYSSLYFDGADDRVEISDSIDVTDEVAIETWINLPFGFVNETINIISNRRHQPNGYGLSIPWHGGGILCFSAGNGTDQESICSNALSWDTNEWYHLAVSYNDHAVTLYRDGLNVGSGTMAWSGDIAPALYDVYIGADPTPQSFLNGYIDEVRVYSRALYPKEVEAHYNGIFADDTGLVGHWDFDEGSGTNINDSSGNGNDGVFVNNGAIYNGAEWVDGKYNDGLSFDGVDDYVEIADNDGLTLPDRLTIEVWFKPGATNFPGYNDLVDKYSSAEDGGYVVDLHDNQIDFWKRGNGLSGVFTNSLTWETDKWYHIIVAIDTVNDTAAIYRDGVSLGLNYYQWPTGYIGDIDESLRIGGEGYVENINGDIDEVRIYNRAISETEAGEHYLGVFNDNTGLVGHWDFDEGTGITAQDSSGNGNDGVLVSSSGDKDGTINGAEWVDGKYDDGLSFDGVDDYIRTAVNNSYDSYNTGTVSFWFKTDKTGLNFVSYSTLENVCSFMGWEITDEGKLSQSWKPPSCGWNNITGSTNVTDNKWHFVEFVADGVNRVKIYLDSVEEATTYYNENGDGNESDFIADVRDINNYNHFTEIGAFHRGSLDNWGYVDGSIDDIRIYNRAISEQEVEEHYHGVFNNNTGLVGFWNFNEGVGGTAYDSSGDDPVWMKYYHDSTDSNVPVTWRVCMDGKNNDCDAIADNYDDGGGTGISDCDGEVDTISAATSAENRDGVLNSDLFGSNKGVTTYDIDIERAINDFTIMASATDSFMIQQIIIEWTTDNWASKSEKVCNNEGVCKVCVEGGTCGAGNDLILSSSLSAGNTFNSRVCVWDGSVNSNKKCTDYNGIRILNSNLVPEITPLSVGNPDFCVGLNYALNWEFVDPDGDTQASYEIQVEEGDSDFTDAGKLVIETEKYVAMDSYLIPNATSSDFIAGKSIEYGKTYNWRVKVTDSRGGEYAQTTEWKKGPPFATPDYEYPRVDFSAVPDYSENCLYDTGYSGSENKCRFGEDITFSDDSIFVECVDSNDKECLVASAARCDTVNNVCAPCENNSECVKFNSLPNISYSCNAGSGICEASGSCLSDDDCKIAEAAKCDLDLASCVFCDDDSQCTNDKFGTVGIDYFCNNAGKCENREHRRWYFYDNSEGDPDGLNLYQVNNYIESSQDIWIVALRIKDILGNVCLKKKNIFFGGAEYPKWNETPPSDSN